MLKILIIVFIFTHFGSVEDKQLQTRKSIPL